MAKEAIEKKLEIRVFGGDGKEKKTVEVDEIVGSSDTHPHLLHQVIIMVEGNKRLGTAMTKMRGEVSGGGKKPWRQKGTGNARHGSTRSPLWRKGGVTFGPQGRLYGFTLPKRMRTEALIAGMKLKAGSGKLLMVEDLPFEKGKTKEAAIWLKKMALKKPLIIQESLDPMVLRSFRNLGKVTLSTADHVGAYDLLSNDECVLTKSGYVRLIERFRKSVDSAMTAGKAAK